MRPARILVLLAITAVALTAVACQPPRRAASLKSNPLRSGAGITWQLQLTARPDLSVPADVYVLDAFDAPIAAVEELHGKGVRAVCRVSVGVAEPDRPDAARFPADILGAPANTGRWLDIRAWVALAPIVSDRFALCRDKGFDGVDPTDVDAYLHQSGFPLTAADQLAYNRKIAALAQDAGLSVGLHNDLPQARELARDFDFAVDESCLAAAACGGAAAFTAAGKTVFHVEYAQPGEDLCPSLRGLGYASIVKRSPVEAWRATC